MKLQPGLVPAVVGAVTAPIVIIAAAVVAFLNPFWVTFEQARSSVPAWTGFTQAQVEQVTGSILSDLVFGPANFDVKLNGVQVLDPREVSHMQDVRSVFWMLGLFAFVAAVLLVVSFVAGRGRRIYSRGLEIGASIFIVGVVVVGAFFALFFDQAFLLFHDLFFAQGTFMFDPRQEKLVQLFPDQFWNETSMGLALVILALAIGLRAVARRRQDAMTGTATAAGPLTAAEPGR
jgi:integral membrane protein (TIGR01906 family)